MRLNCVCVQQAGESGEQTCCDEVGEVVVVPCGDLSPEAYAVLPDAPLPALAVLPDVPSAGLAFLADVLFAGVELAFLGGVSFAAVVLGFVLLGIGVLLGLAQVIDGVIRPLPLDQHCCLSSSKPPARSRSRTAGPP